MDGQENDELFYVESLSIKRVRKREVHCLVFANMSMAPMLLIWKSYLQMPGRLSFYIISDVIAKIFLMRPGISGDSMGFVHGKAP